MDNVIEHKEKISIEPLIYKSVIFKIYHPDDEWLPIEKRRVLMEWKYEGQVFDENCKIVGFNVNYILGY